MSQSKPRVSPGAAQGDLLDLYRTMVLIRRVEERLATLFADGEVPGFIHLSIGQEAISAGMMKVLSAEDTIASTHRGHGHAIAKGLPLDGFFAELMGMEEGICRGRGGSMHVADMSVGMLGANGIVGAGLSIALGSALAHKTLGREAVAIAFFGDGALAEGLLHECLNMAALWSLPILFVCENNGWSEFSPTSTQVACDLEKLGNAFGIRHARVDGNDVLAVLGAASAIVPAVRAGGGPAIVECMTARVRGHYEGDTQKYRTSDEIAALPERDPLRLAGLDLPETARSEVADEVERLIEQAVADARRGRSPDFASAAADVYAAASA